MIEFLDIDTPHKSTEYDKGILFEDLVRRLVESAGYEITNMRRKQNSLEYDISAASKLGKQLLVGEAKALQRKISGELTQFVGKMTVPWDSDPNTLGLFISTSSLTADVEDYIENVKKRHKLEVIAGTENILRHLAKHCGYPTVQSIQERAAQEFGGNAGECLFIVTDRGDFFIQLMIEPSLTLPTCFAVYNRHGVLVTDEDFYKVLKESFAILRDLKPLTTAILTTDGSHVDRRNFLSIIAGRGWFDYKLPAPPECFVGREAILQKIETYIDEVCTEKTGVRLFEILSRSGVGKSSLTI